LKNGTAFPLVLTAFLAIAVLYAPQPLLPYFAQQYGITETRAALVVAVVLAPLSIAPLSFGALLQRLPSALVLRGSMVTLGLLVALQAVEPSFGVLVALRVLEGVAVAAILTAIMTYIAAFATGHAMSRLMAWYVAATILGGFLGRLLAGLTAAYASWPMFSLGLAGAILLSVIPLARLEQRAPVRTDEASSKRARFRDVLRVPRYVRTYVLIFSLFFSFSAFMNFLPFRLHEVRPGASELLTGLVYVGYVAGIVVSLKAPALARWAGSEGRLALAGTTIGLGALIVADVAATWALFVAVVLMCVAMFMTHGIAAGWINRASGSRSSLINGLYVAVYYAGGVLGAYVPGFVYERAGWTAFLLVLGGLTLAALGAAGRWWWDERRTEPANPSR
jgi:YNFM family putative membrane transporter